MDVKLIVIEGRSSRNVAIIHRQRTMIGRGKECSPRIKSSQVSRTHCELKWDGLRLRVRDLGSTNGTFVNGVRAREAELRPGDTLQIGPITFLVQINGVPSGVEPPPPTVAAPTQADDEPQFIVEDADAASDADLVEAVYEGPAADDAADFVVQEDPAAQPDEFIIFDEDEPDQPTPTPREDKRSGYHVADEP